MKYSYQLERESIVKQQVMWLRVGGAYGLKSYVQGWFDALTSLYPCPVYRIVREDGKVIEEGGGNSCPKPN